ncbi:MAG: hypothetical protein A2046_16500 [Bacteroidetes bacterium GWA2_30_7]|nr:MAG: hypothetical protein A2046_16500 [Bacteroidetes bacterium GWA2_30_7]
MKNLSLIFSIIALVGVITVMIMAHNGHSKKSESKNESTKIYFNDSTGTSTRIAFINTDSLLLKYNLYNELKDKLLSHQKELEAEFGRKSSTFEKEAAEFQRKVQNNSFLSLESAQAQEQEMYKKQQDLMELKDNMSNQLMTKEQEMTGQLFDSITKVVKEFNADKKFNYIINNNLSSTLLYGEENFNLTDTIASILNSRLKQESAK